MNSRALPWLLALLLAVLLLPAAAQPFNQVVVIQPVKHDASPDITELLPGKVSHERREVPLFKPGNGHGPPSGGGGGGFTDPVLQSSAGASSASSGFSHIFNGQGTESDNYIPPDTNGAAGPYQYVQTVNVTLAAYDKSGGLVYGPTSINTLWSGFGGSCESSNGGDPIVQYDKINGRWVVLQIQYSGFGGKGGNFLCMAVSNGNDWSASNFSWQRYAYKFNTLTDYPKLGIWNDAYYVTFNAFKGFGTYAGPVVCAFDLGRAGASGNSLCASLSTAYASLLPADIDSSSQAPIAGEPEYLLSLGSPLLSWRFHLDLPALAQGNSGTSSLSSAQAVTVSSTTFPSGLAFQQACGGGTCVPQPGTTQQLDSLGDRLMYRLAYRNFGSYESLVVNHSVAALSTGVTGIRWYEVRNTPSTSSTTPYVYQAGTFAPDSSYRWMGSVAMDASGNIAAGYSASSSSLHPSIYTAARCSSDTPNILGAESLVQLGTGSQTGYNRWGDYASMSVDPADGSLWFTTEYLVNDGSFNWHTKIANFSVTGCP